MIEPLRKDDAFLADARAARGEEGTGHLWWLGQSGFLLHWEGRFLLLDPYLSDSLTAKYAGTDKPHVRMTERVVAPEALDFIDVATSSHNHTDHLDAETLGPLLRKNPEMALVAGKANLDFAADRLRVEPSRFTAVDAGESVEVGGFKLHAVPAAHEEVARDEAGHCKYLGFVVEFGPWRLYHSGDTLLYDGIVEAVRPFAPQVAILPINGRVPERRVAGNLDGAQAAWLGAAVGARQVIPCHFEMFAFNTASPEGFIKAANEEGVGPRVLRAGERWSTEELQS